MTKKYAIAVIWRENTGVQHTIHEFGSQSFFNNLKVFDGHILCESIGLFKDHDIKCIPNNMEKYISFSVGNRFFSIHVTEFGNADRKFGVFERIQYTSSGVITQKRGTNTSIVTTNFWNDNSHRRRHFTVSWVNLTSHLKITESVERIKHSKFGSISRSLFEDWRIAIGGRSREF